MNKDTKPDNAALRSQVEQLRVEANMNRKKVSECTKESVLLPPPPLIILFSHLEYCESHKAQDFLVNGPSPGLENVFVEKKKCTLF